MNTKYLNELLDLLIGQTDSTSMEAALRELLSDSEINDISNRWQILKLLEQGHTQRDVAKRLGVGIATVTRGAKALKMRHLNQTSRKPHEPS